MDELQEKNLRLRFKNSKDKRDAQRNKIWDLELENKRLLQEMGTLRDILSNVNKLLELKVGDR